MKKLNLLFVALIILVAFSSCDSTEENPGKEYPEGSIVWKKDTTVTLTNHFIVPVGTSLYVEEGVTVVMNDTTVRPEIIILGNLY